MGDYVSIIKEAFAFFPMIAFIFTVPYILHNYHKYGSIKSIRIFIVYSFILYLMNVYFLVIMPLPSVEVVSAMTGPRAQLIPLNFVRDIWEESKEIHGLALLKRPVVLQVAYNVLMTVPFGMYLRYYFEFKFTKTFRFSFYLAMFFEVTQLSGLYFIYPRGYRLFDVDDLLTNTLGGLIGYILITPFLCVLPHRNEIDELSFKRGKNISPLRRWSAFFVDAAILSIVIVSAALAFSLPVEKSLYVELVSVLVLFMVIPVLLKGQTIGMKYTKIKLVSVKGKLHWYQIIIRYIVLYLMLFRLPIWLFKFTEYLNDNILPDEYLFISNDIMFATYAFILLVELILMLVHRRILCEKISGTKVISTIKVENDSDNLEDENDESLKIKKHREKKIKKSE